MTTICSGISMYPEVHEGFVKFNREYSDVSVLPTPAYFYGLQSGEEIAVDIEAGKTLFIKLINIGEVDKDGRRAVNFELNGVARAATVADKSVAAEVAVREKGRSVGRKPNRRAHSRHDYHRVVQCRLEGCQRR